MVNEELSFSLDKASRIHPNHGVGDSNIAVGEVKLCPPRIQLFKAAQQPWVSATGTRGSGSSVLGGGAGDRGA